MLAKRMGEGLEVLGDPLAGLWGRFAARKVALMSAPVGLQGSKYVLARWAQGQFGHTRAAGLQCAHNGQELAFRLEWECEQPVASVLDNDQFADAAALLFPLTEAAPLMMGTEGAGVSIWHWRADRPEAARLNVAEGIGTSRLTKAAAPVVTRSVHRGGRWAVVFCRGLEVRPPAAQGVRFAAGGRYRVAVAVWSGAHGERAGLKAFSPEWVDVELEG